MSAANNLAELLWARGNKGPTGAAFLPPTDSADHFIGQGRHSALGLMLARLDGVAADAGAPNNGLSCGFKACDPDVSYRNFDYAFLTGRTSLTTFSNDDQGQNGHYIAPFLTSLDLRPPANGIGGIGLWPDTNCTGLYLPQATTFWMNASWPSGTIFHGAYQQTKFIFPLVTTMGWFSITNNDYVTHVSFPSATDCVGGQGFGFYSNPVMTDVLFPLLENGYYCYVESCPALERVDVDSFLKPDPYGTFGFYSIGTAALDPADLKFSSLAGQPQEDTNLDFNNNGWTQAQAAAFVDKMYERLLNGDFYGYYLGLNFDIENVSTGTAGDFNVSPDLSQIASMNVAHNSSANATVSGVLTMTVICREVSANNTVTVAVVINQTRTTIATNIAAAINASAAAGIVKFRTLFTVSADGTYVRAKRKIGGDNSYDTLAVNITTGIGNIVVGNSAITQNAVTARTNLERLYGGPHAKITKIIPGATPATDPCVFEFDRAHKLQVGDPCGIRYIHGNGTAIQFRCAGQSFYPQAWPGEDFAGWSPWGGLHYVRSVPNSYSITVNKAISYWGGGDSGVPVCCVLTPSNVDQTPFLTSGDWGARAGQRTNAEYMLHKEEWGGWMGYLP